MLALIWMVGLFFYSVLIWVTFLRGKCEVDDRYGWSYVFGLDVLMQLLYALRVFWV